MPSHPPFRTGPGRRLQLHRKEHIRGRLPARAASIVPGAGLAYRSGRFVRAAVKITAWMATESWFQPPTEIVSERDD